MSEISPLQFASYLRAIAAGIDASENPRASPVASDIRCAIAAVNGDDRAAARVAQIAQAHDARTASKRQASESIALKFKGQLDPALLQRAASEIRSRRPGLEGKKLEFSLTAKVAD